VIHHNKGCSEFAEEAAAPMSDACKSIEYTTIRHVVAVGLDQSHARWLRGAVATRATRPEFHHHRGDALIYSHPLIRYHVIQDAAVIAGVAEGAPLVRGMPRLDELALGGQAHRVLERVAETARIEVGPTTEAVDYAVTTPYLALNQDNHPAWERGGREDRRRLLERVVVGNLLSFSKAIGMHVDRRLVAEVDLEPDGWHDLKPGVRLLGFRGTIRVNFALPEGWGIGKSGARGFGTLFRKGG